VKSRRVRQSDPVYRNFITTFFTTEDADILVDVPFVCVDVKKVELSRVPKDFM
jgi:hypothetical protein